jgi:hypothetical protein
MEDKEIVLTLRKVISEVQEHKNEIMKAGRPLNSQELRSLEHLAHADRLLQESKHEIFAALANSSQKNKEQQNRQQAA